MVTTGIVYALLLSGLEESLQTPLPWVNLVLHYIMPVVVALDWGIDPPRARISLPRALLWLAFPLLYLGYSLVRGRLVGWYPYPFLNPEIAGGYGGVALYTVTITIGLMILTGLVVWTAHRRGERVGVR